MDVKIPLSKKELRCMSDTDFLLTKRVVTDKLSKILHDLAEILKASPVHEKFPFPHGTNAVTGKLSRGENFKGLPYLMLDFPRLFEKENIFAFRTMFWWGNYFSFTLHLRGKALDQFRHCIIARIGKLEEKNIFIYTGDNEWEHDWQGSSYERLNPIHAPIIERANFLKLSRKLKLSDYHLLLTEGVETYNALLKAMNKIDH